MGFNQKYLLEIDVNFSYLLSYCRMVQNQFFRTIPGNFAKLQSVVKIITQFQELNKGTSKKSGPNF